jgi:hypothetical protein
MGETARALVDASRGATDRALVAIASLLGAGGARPR